MLLLRQEKANNLNELLLIKEEYFCQINPFYFQIPLEKDTLLHINNLKPGPL